MDFKNFAGNKISKCKVLSGLYIVKQFNILELACTYYIISLYFVTCKIEKNA